MVIAYLVVFSALAILLHIPQYPYPYAPWLKFDLAGVPITVLMLADLRLGMSSLPIFWVGSLILTTDPTRVIGPSMKVLAELFTALPLALTYRKLVRRFGISKASAIGFSIALISRVCVMLLLNYLVAPYWMVWAKWAKTLEDAYIFTITYLPHNVVFNAIVVCYVAPIAISAYRTLEKYIHI